MKASPAPSRFILTAMAAMAIAAITPAVLAEDAIFLQSGPPRTGTITGVSGTNVQLQLKSEAGTVQTSVPLAQIRSIRMAEPSDYTRALAAWEKGDAAGTLSALQPVVQKFRGLPTPWAERASALLGEVYLTLNQIPEAEKAFADFEKAYPGSASQNSVGLARLALAKNNLAEAKGQLQPIVDEASGVLLAEGGKNAMYGQAFFLMGQVREAEGDLPNALNDYLKAVVVFAEDKAVAAKAQERADVLIKEKNVVVP